MTISISPLGERWRIVVTDSNRQVWNESASSKYQAIGRLVKWLESEQLNHEPTTHTS